MMKIRSSATIVFSLLLLGGLSGLAHADIPSVERAALIALYNSTDGDNWLNNNGWKNPPLHGDGFAQPDTECSWYGISCAGDAVTTVDLKQNQLIGSIPAELGNLVSLHRLYLDSNRLSGSIPAELGNLINLQWLVLSDNQLSGSIPPELANLSSLWLFSLQSNRLTGSIPAEIGNLVNLQHLYLDSNQLSGSIPSDLGKLANLHNLQLSNNQLTGSMPPELGDMTNLRSIYLYSNLLSGSIPPELGNLTLLDTINFSGNHLSGSIPIELTTLTNMKILILDSNLLSGNIPADLDNLSNLQHLILGGNLLGGNIPAELGKLTHLIRLDVSSNQLVGGIPPELGNLSHLEMLALSSNRLSSSIPAELGNLSNLEVLYLHDNRLSAAIPAELGSLNYLQRLHLYSNQFLGNIPVELQNITSLDSLNICYNYLYSSDPQLRNFLNGLQPNWETCQRKLLSLSIPLSATEGDGAVQGSLSIQLTFDSDFVVSLASGDPSEVTVPSTVTIDAGRTSTDLDLIIVDDSVFDSTQTVTITANALGWMDSAAINIIDKNDIDEDALPDWWETRYFGDLNQDSGDDYDGDSVVNVQEYNDGNNPANQNPEQPVLLVPENASIGLPMRPYFATGSFSDPDGDGHHITDWVINDLTGPVFSATSTTCLTELVLPELIFTANTQYFWQVRFEDDMGARSAWSELRQITTGNDPIQWQDRVPDTQALVANDPVQKILDLNDDGIRDVNQPQAPKWKCLNAEMGGGQVGIEAIANIDTIDAFMAIDPAGMADTANMPDAMPFGLVAFKLAVTDSDQPAKVKLYSTVNIPDNAGIYKHDAEQGWHTYPNVQIQRPANGYHFAEITLWDGGDGDCDGLKNGFIIDPVGAGLPKSDGGGSGGCFIDTSSNRFRKRTKNTIAMLIGFAGVIGLYVSRWMNDR